MYIDSEPNKLERLSSVVVLPVALEVQEVKTPSGFSAWTPGVDLLGFHRLDNVSHLGPTQFLSWRFIGVPYFDQLPATLF